MKPLEKFRRPQKFETISNFLDATYIVPQKMTYCFQIFVANFTSCGIS